MSIHHSISVNIVVLRCQDVFVNAVVDENYHTDIAKNKALKENVFMMIVCIENRIPLFVIGKPGSSKSLAKALVMDSMKGSTSKNELFVTMKNVGIVVHYNTFYNIVH